MQRLRTPGASMALWIGLLATGCGTGPGTVEIDAGTEIDAGPVELEAGTSGADGAGYVATEDGTDVFLVPGAQSGFHVWLNVRVHGIAGELMIERAARRQRDGVLVFRGLPQRMEVPDTALDDWWESPVASPAFMCPSPIGIQVFDEALVFEVRLLDPEADEGAAPLAEDTLVLIPHCPADEQAEFCMSICSG
jgi:hypothetical protein